MITLLGLFLFVLVAGTAAFTWLLAWCFESITAVSGASSDPLGDLTAAWWLAVAWVRAWLGGAIDSHNRTEDIT